MKPAGEHAILIEWADAADHGYADGAAGGQWFLFGLQDFKTPLFCASQSLGASQNQNIRDPSSPLKSPKPLGISQIRAVLVTF